MSARLMTPKAIAARERRALRGDVRTCVQCGGEFLALRTDAKYCKPQCSWAAQPPHQYPALGCPTCGDIFTPQKKTQTYCSLTCRPRRGPTTAKVLAQFALQRELKSLRRRLAYLEAKIEAHPEWATPCKACGNRVGKGLGNKGGAKQYCSAACYQSASRVYATLGEARRHAKDTRRARKANAYVAAVSRRAIYERDAWVCQLCGKPTVPEARVPHPMAPTLDHVLALANGGTHEPANVQCAHFLCNAIKGDREWVS